MRCQFCGWDNPQGKNTCEKCNKPLAEEVYENKPAVSEPVSDNHNRPTDRQANAVFNPKETLREAQAVIKTSGEDKSKCPECGYKLENGSCASCGYSVVQPEEKSVHTGRVAAEVRKTVRPLRKGEKDGEFTLTPISEETGVPEGEALSYEGNEVLLNRDNTDPKNQTITSATQAVVRCEGGKWTVEDNSEYKTTFVQAARKIEIRKGDLILLGNQLYRFDA